LPGKYGVNVTFNISDLTMFDVGDEGLRSNPFKERECWVPEYHKRIRNYETKLFR
jgi:hypothetical protein